MSNVIPLFAKNFDLVPSIPVYKRNDARTHFAHPSVPEATLCGREFTAYIDKDSAYPECQECITEHTESTGWAFPLPPVVSTG